MKSFKVYLAGPIQGLTYTEATNGWRDYVTALLSDYDGINCYSPMRFKSVLKDELILDGTEYEGKLTNPASIVTRDTYDVRSSDLIFVNLIGAKKVSIGTCCEIGMAMAFNKPMVIAKDVDCKIHQNPFITHSTPFQAQSLEEAVELTTSILLNK